MVRKITPRLTGAFFILILFIVACGNSPNITPAEKEAFINTYVDLSLAKIKYRDKGDKYSSASSSIYDRYGTSEEYLNEILDRIESDYETQQEIFKVISKKLEDFEKMSPDSFDLQMKNLLVEP